MQLTSTSAVSRRCESSRRRCASGPREPATTTSVRLGVGNADATHVKREASTRGAASEASAVEALEWRVQDARVASLATRTAASTGSSSSASREDAVIFCSARLVLSAAVRTLAKDTRVSTAGPGLSDTSGGWCNSEDATPTCPSGRAASSARCGGNTRTANARTAATAAAYAVDTASSASAP